MNVSELCKFLKDKEISYAVPIENEFTGGVDALQIYFKDHTSVHLDASFAEIMWTIRGETSG